MAPKSYAQQGLCNNLPSNPIKKQDELANPQGQAKRSDASSNKASIFSKVPTLPLIPLTKDLFTKFIKAFVKLIQAWDQEQVKL